MGGDRIAVFIGSDETNVAADQVTINSIEEHCTCDVDFVSLRQGSLGFSDWRNLRFAIPEMLGLKGKAIYLSAGAVVLSDIKELIDWIPNEPAWVTITGYGTDVSIINCDQFNWNWWIAIDWMRMNDWKVDKYVWYLRQHRQFLAAHRADWFCIDGRNFSEFSKMVMFQDQKPWMDGCGIAPELMDIWLRYVG